MKIHIHFALPPVVTHLQANQCKYAFVGGLVCSILTVHLNLKTIYFRIKYLYSFIFTNELSAK